MCHSGRAAVNRQDSTSSAASSLDQSNAGEQRMLEDVSDVTPPPQFALRQDLDSRRPTAKVQVLSDISLCDLFVHLFADKVI